MPSQWLTTLNLKKNIAIKTSDLDPSMFCSVSGSADP
jgi:hypothetical protein